MAKLVEATYGDALYELAVSNNITDRLYDEAVVLLDIFDTDSELMAILNHPKIVREDRISIIENSIGKFVSKEMTGFLVTIADKDRCRYIPATLRFFIERIKEYKGIGTAYVTTPYELSDAINNAFVIDSKYYTDYQVMWMRDASDEVIWKIGMSSTSYGGALGKELLSYNNSTYNPRYHFAEAILDLYDENDKRASIFCTPTKDVNGDEVYLITKYPGNTDLDGGDIPRFVNMPKPLRLSEVYLVRAEAYYWLNDDENSQKDLSSVMRKRISGFGSLGVSGDDLLKEIKNERARELYLEGFRLSDLKRWHDPIKRQKQLYSLQGPYNNEMEVKYTDAKYRFTTWPIPKHEIEATNGLVVGNASNN